MIRIKVSAVATDLDDKSLGNISGVVEYDDDGIWQKTFCNGSSLGSGESGKMAKCIIKRLGDVALNLTEKKG